MREKYLVNQIVMLVKGDNCVIETSTINRVVEATSLDNARGIFREKTAAVMKGGIKLEIDAFLLSDLPVYRQVPES